MRPARHRDTGQQDLLRSRLDQIVNPAHALVKMARAIDWQGIAKLTSAGAGRRGG